MRGFYLAMIVPFNDSMPYPWKRRNATFCSGNDVGGAGGASVVGRNRLHGVAGMD